MAAITLVGINPFWFDTTQVCHLGHSVGQSVIVIGITGKCLGRQNETFSVGGR